ncbi:hypothetical protein [Methylobacterium fujisawaense]
MSPATDPGRAAEEMRVLARELMDFHGSLDDGRIGDGAFTIRCENGENEQTRLNLRAVLREAAAAIAQLQADLIAAQKERDEARRDHDALAEWWKMNPSLIQHRIAAAEAEAAQLRARLHEAEKGAEAMRGHCMEVIQAVYDGWAKNDPDEKWPRVALSNAMTLIRQIPPRLEQEG